MKKTTLSIAACLCVFAAAAQTTFNASGTGQTGSVQTYIVPSNVTSVSIEAFGAQGGNTNGGLGARMKGNFAVNAGDTIKVVVGQQGVVNNCGGSNASSGGGGGSFVWTGNGSTATLLVAAGAGGGGNTNWSGLTCRVGIDADTLMDGTQGNGSISALGGTNGTGGFGNAPSGTGSGGAGWKTSGQNSTYGTGCTGGLTAFQFTGGFGSNNFGPGGEGGYGGGGGAVCGNGGGGGYSGGGGGEGSGCRAGGGGGGSYNIGTSQSNSKGVQSGNGKVIVTPVSTTGITESSDLGLLTVSPNPSQGLLSISVSFAGKKEFTLTLVNLLGETVKTLEHSEVYGTYARVFDISDVPAGIYFVAATTSSGVTTQRIVKQD